MALELCLEAAMGLAGQSADTLTANLFVRFGRRDAAVRLDDDRADDDIAFREAVAASLPALTASEASAVWLVDVCGASYAEAAASLGSTPETVASTIRSARRRIHADVHRPLP